MTKDKALRLALEAMKINNKAWKLLADSGDAGNWEAEEQGYYQLNEQAINAIKEALETKDEPVGWIDSKGFMICVKTDESCRPLYTTPQRTWVGLTDEEIEESKPPLSNDAVVWELAVEWAEAKLKEKNT